MAPYGDLRHMAPHGDCAIFLWRNRHMAPSAPYGARIWRNHHMAPSGAIWRHLMELFKMARKWRHMAPFAPFPPYGAISCFCQMKNGGAPFLSPSTPFNGAIWRHLAPSGAIYWRHLAPSGAIWRHMAQMAPCPPYGAKMAPFSRHMAPYGAKMAPYGACSYLTLLPVVSSSF